jgi:predicted nuclease of predicted toxin-antitoxin system
MKILLDENLPVLLRHQLAEHDVRTVRFMGWDGIRNGELMRRAAAEGFEALVTMDRGFLHQHAMRPLGIVLLEAVSNDLTTLEPLMTRVLEALLQLTPGRVVHVS